MVSDASPLIWLSKIGRIQLLRSLFEEVIIPEEVYREAVERGLAEGFSDSLVIKTCVEQGWLKVESLKEEEIRLSQRITEHAFEIHAGEAQATLLAKKTNALLLMDESSGRAFAEAWGLRVRGTIFVILKALRDGLINREAAKESVMNLIGKGFRIDPRLLGRVLKEIEMFTPRSGR